MPFKTKHLLISIPAIAVVLYLGAALVYKYREQDLVFLTKLGKQMDPTTTSRLGLDVDEVKLKVPDGETLNGWVVYPDTEKATGQWVIFFHGNAGNVSNRYYPERYKVLTSNGYGVITFDYRGFGNSTGQPSEAGLYQDAEAIYNYAREVRHISSDSLTLFGYSLGTGLATYIASKQPAAGLILEAPYTSIPDVAGHVTPFLPVGILMQNKFSSLERIGSVRCPLLILHAEDDLLIPFSHGETLLNTAKVSKTLVPIKGGHEMASLKDSARYYGAVLQFLSGLKGAH